MHLRRHERLRRCAYERDSRAQVLRRLLHVLAHEAEHLGALGRIADEHAAVDDRADLVQTEHERRDDPEVAAAATDAPVEVRVLARAALDETPVGEGLAGLFRYTWHLEVVALPDDERILRVKSVRELLRYF